MLHHYCVKNSGIVNPFPLAQVEARDTEPVPVEARDTEPVPVQPRNINGPYYTPVELALLYGFPTGPGMDGFFI
jgi:hypothetical protein